MNSKETILNNNEKQNKQNNVKYIIIGLLLLVVIILVILFLYIYLKKSDKSKINKISVNNQIEKFSITPELKELLKDL